MKRPLLLIIGLIISCTVQSQTLNLIRLSADLLAQSKQNYPPNEMLQSLANCSEQLLIQQLSGDTEKNIFWINLYNATVQIALRENAEGLKKHKRFFRQPRVLVAGKMLSLNDIQHGILRHSRRPWGGGRYKKWFPSHFEKTQRVVHPDFRIHFLLNNGSTESPQILVLQPERAERLFQLSIHPYLSEHVNCDTSRNKIIIPAFFKWYRADFGGEQGIYKLLRTEQIIKPDCFPTLVYRPFNWKPQPGKFWED